MSIKKHIPNCITCMNLASGCVAIVMASQEEFLWAALFILLGSVFDFFDGMVARLLNVKSEIGKELDSLSDVVSFGVAPAMIMYKLLCSLMPESTYVPFVAFLLAVFSGYRLAKFNVDTRQTCSFIGLPTPANALFMTSLAALQDPRTPSGWLNLDCSLIINPAVVLFLIVLFSYLLICELPMFSLKFKNLKWRDNKKQFILIILSVILAAIFQMAAIPMIVILFIGMSIFAAVSKK